MKHNAMLAHTPKTTPNVANDTNLSTTNESNDPTTQPLNTSNTLPKMSKPKKDQPRHSLQPQPITQPILVPLRHTKSHNYDKKRISGGGAKKKAPLTTIPTIHEVDGESTASGDNVEVVNEKKKEKKRGSVSSGGSKRRSQGYDNGGFEGNLAGGGRQTQFQRSSTQHSLISTSSSMRDVSVRSLPVIREQYCCRSRWSACEKILITIVAILAVMIIGLVIAVSYLVSDKGGVSEAFHWSF